MIVRTSLFLFLLLTLIHVTAPSPLSSGDNGAAVVDDDLSPADYLSLGDGALQSDNYARAVSFYKLGLASLKEGDDATAASLLTVLFLETNLATAYSSMGKVEEAVVHYRSVVSKYQESKDAVDADTAGQSKEIASQASFFLGMVFQDADLPQESLKSYGDAVIFDPNHWAALANLGSVLHDQLANHDEALEAYNRAFELLTEHASEVTDPPPEPRFILSQLQYRIGLCLTHDPQRKCALTDDPDQQVSCKEMATHAFSLAVQYDPDNESAKHMLATITADATMKRASNIYVKNLFDDYAQK